MINIEHIEDADADHITLSRDGEPVYNLEITPGGLTLFRWDVDTERYRPLYQCLPPEGD